MKKVLALAMAMTILLGTTACNGGEKSAWTPRREKAAQDEFSAAQGYKVLETACGPIKGIQREGYAEYRGIRYATSERWERAVPVTGWDGEYDATAFGDRASQFRGFYGVENSPVNQFYYDEAAVHPDTGFSEDCLNLNLWVPEEAKDCPVLLFIHGGAFLTGGSDEPFIDGAPYAKNGVLMVSINYRLGPFQAVYADGVTGNFALTDQVAALQWVRDNIADYGGDPTRVTIMGESAGAISVQNLLLSPLAKGLFSGAVMMSGAGDLSKFATPVAPDHMEPVWTQLKANLGVDDLSGLKERPAASVYANWLQAVGQQPAYAAGAANPIVDGEILPANVRTALKEGIPADVPCIIGVLSEDMWPHSLYTAAMDYAVGQSEVGKASVYTYFFDRQLPGDGGFGAYHAADLWYAFGTLYRNVRPFEEVDYRISQDMVAYLVNFVKTGDPNGRGLPKWEAVTANNQKSLNFGEAKPAMMEPDMEALAETERTHQPFPHK